jgi:cytochrome P450
MSRAAMATVEPLPPVVGGLPRVGAGLSLLRDPTAFFAGCRARHGDTFVVDAFGYRLFCVFSPEGVRQLYQLPENEASFGLATYRLIKFKLPEELVMGRRNSPHRLFGNQQVEGYVDNLEAAVAQEIDVLGDAGDFEIFGEMRRLSHRLGFASWAGTEAASPAYLDRLIPMFDRIDSAEAFVRPAAAFRTMATKQRREREAMHGIEQVIAEIWADRQRRSAVAGDFLETLFASYDDLPPDEQAVGAARDVIMLHVGALSNLYAALAWTVVNVVTRPDLVEAIRAGDDALLERVASESIRMAQRSITLREVLRPVTVEAGGREYSLGKGCFVTTMLSVTNTTVEPSLREFDPAHYVGRKLVVDLPARELVSTFGHRSHSCPASRFSITAIRIATRRFLDHYDLTPRFHDASPRRRQLGGVARAQRPCPVSYRRRS